MDSDASGLRFYESMSSLKAVRILDMASETSSSGPRNNSVLLHSRLDLARLFKLLPGSYSGTYRSVRDARAVFPHAGVGGLESWQAVNISVLEVTYPKLLFVLLSTWSCERLFRINT